VRNSGTIRLAEEEAIKRARDFVRRARSSTQGPGLEQVLKSAMEVEEREIGSASMDDEDVSEDE
jgi:hypothetical protein